MNETTKKSEKRPAEQSGATAVMEPKAPPSAGAVAAPVETKTEVTPVAANPLDAQIKELDDQIAAVKSSKDIPDIAKDAAKKALEETKKTLVDNREVVAKKMAELEADDELTPKGRKTRLDAFTANLGKTPEPPSSGGEGKDRFGVKRGTQAAAINSVLETATSETTALTIKQIAEKAHLGEGRVKGHLMHWIDNNQQHGGVPGLGKVLKKLDKDGATKWWING